VLSDKYTWRNCGPLSDLGSKPPNEMVKLTLDLVDGNPRAVHDGIVSDPKEVKANALLCLDVVTELP